MKVRSFVFAVAAAGATVSASSAMAAAPRELVRYDDLRLTTAEGQAELQERLNRAAWKVCMFDASGALRTSEHHTVCYRATRKDAAVRMARAIAAPRLGG